MKIIDTNDYDTIEEFELLKQEKEREKFYKEQQAFIEYEERVHKRR